MLLQQSQTPMLFVRRISKILIVLILLFILGCTNPNNQKHGETALNESINTEIIDSIKIEDEKLESIDLDKIFQEVIQKQFPSAISKKIVYDKKYDKISTLAQMFDTTGITEIIVYPRPKMNYDNRHFMGNYHEYFYLMVLEYKNDSMATQIFDNVVQAFKVWNTLEFMTKFKPITPHLKDFEKELYWETPGLHKAGGFYTVKDNRIYYLVETCGGTPKYWAKYNKRLIDALFKANPPKQTLNFDCGGRFVPLIF